jgi:hypothetical protein
VSCRTETAGARAYRFCPDDAPPAADRVRALLQARVVDEITREPIEVDVTPTTTLRGVTPRSSPGGVVGLVGQPARRFPGLDVNPVNLDLRVSARGYLPLDLGGMLGPIPGFPNQFAPLDLLDVGMHRVSVVLRGRTLRRGSLAPTVVAGASVDVIGWWPVFPPANVAPATVMQAPNLVSLAPGVYTPRLTGVTSVRRRDVPALPGEDKVLLRPAARGATRVRLSNRSALAAGAVLILDADDLGRRELVPVATVDTSSSTDQPAWVGMAHPLAQTHLERVRCRVGNLQVPAGVNLLTRSAIPGDETVFLDGLVGLASGVVVEVDDGASPPEYHEARLYRTVSDADGYFRLPPVARVAQLLLRAQRIGLTPPDDMRLGPDYRVPENRVTVVFP